MKTPCPTSLLLAVVVTGVALLTGCQTTSIGSSATSSGAPASPDTLRVGITPNMPPLISRQGGTIQGLEADLARELATSMGRTAVFVEEDFEDLIPALLENRVDILMSGMSVTSARQFRVSFTEPYLRVGQMALIRAADTRKFAFAITMKDRRVGVVKGTTGDLYIQQSFTTAHRKTYTDAEDGADALIDGDIDMFVHDAPSVWWLASEHEADGLTYLDQFLTRESLAWAVRKNDRELMQAANKFLQEARTQGLLDECIRTWIPLTP